MKNSRRIRNFNSRNGFMLMELVVVVMVLGILAAAAAGRATDVASQAASSTLKTNLTIIADAIERETQFSGSIPASIDPKCFQAAGCPHIRKTVSGIPAVQVDSPSAAEHPANKVLKGSMPGAYWYNPQNGIVRARVTDQGSSAATLQLYNDVNQSAETDLGNYGGGGGGGGS